MLMEGYVATHKSELKVNRSCKNVPNLQLFFRLLLAKHWVISPHFFLLRIGLSTLLRWTLMCSSCTENSGVSLNYHRLNSNPGDDLTDVLECFHSDEFNSFGYRSPNFQRSLPMLNR
ncbi:hypothetical protein OUZ56_005853 [Daphnia magna]|uniref:Uncharacterized protein n=1 Tax=Daphnia magna TaxID=35525 RepID=A0ABQ9YU12_9CRUS|nr:hypothetical protein OUZ56_005853 [Daphnia magna]